MANTIRPAQPRRRVIMNYDGQPREMFGRPEVDWDALVRNNVEILAGTHVDALFWGMCSGYIFIHDTEVGEFLGEHLDTFESVTHWRLHENAKGLIAEGRDPLKGIVEAGHRIGLEVFASLRMNDLHDSRAHDQLGKLKRDHPEYLLGEAANVYAGGKPFKYSAMTGFNFALPQVRKFKLDVVRDTLNRYDVDGFEVDWTRNPAAFKPGEELANLGVMNDFMSQIRQQVDETSARRGKPVYLAASVPGDFQYSRQLGLDVRTWLEERMFDILTVNGPPFAIELEAYGEVTRQVGCQLFARMIRHPVVFTDPNVLRATAANYWLDGADGIYFFNCFGREGAERARIHEVGDPKVLDRLDKHYVVAQRPDPFPEVVHTVIRQPESTQPLPIQLHVAAHGKGPVIPLKIADDIDGAVADDALKEVKLQLRLENFCPDTDQLVCKLNGQVLRKSELRDESVAVCHLEFEIDGRPLTKGENKLDLVLEKRNPRITGAVVLTDVELVILYK